MLGFTRCASTACFTEACQYIAGVPLCREHRDEMREHFATWVDSDGRPTTWTSKGVVTRTKKQNGPRVTRRVMLSPQQSSADPGDAEVLGCVYYVTTRQDPRYIKIGTTRSASGRFRSLSATGRVRLLVAEPGGRSEENQRHIQFSSLRVPGTELFRYEEPLVGHVASLRQRYPTYRDLTDVGHDYD